MIGGFMQQMRRRTPLGWLQLRHDKTRVLVAMAGIAFADILIFMQLGFRDAFFDSNTMLPRSLEADLILISPRAREMTRLYTFPRRRLFQAMDVPGVNSVEALYVSFLDWKKPQTQQKTQMLVVGQNPSKPAFDLPAINRQLSAIKQPDTVLFDATSRGNYQEVIARLQTGENITSEIDRITVTIAGTFNLGASFAVDGTLIASQQTFLRLFPRWQVGTVSIGKIKLESGTDPEVIRTALNEYLPDDVRALTHAEYIDFELNYWNTRSPIAFIFGLGSTMGFIVGVVIVYQVLSTDVNAHLSEYATFKAMGYRDRYLLGVVFEEAIILAVLGFVPGVAVSTGLYALTRKATALPIVLPLGRVVFVFALTIVMCGFSGAIATRRLRSADPADIF
ncbi:MAG: FtsX-like permease family protein [Hormoscilla sp. SP5CHS1]|uniref:DevC ABC transport system permease n=1 Tax=Hormoscilla spongeliae SP12 TaxID=1962683 RepID=A0A1S6M1N8_9CYAN|nr:DevC ABC transport system permease [Hormoscilla spongeliae SP12]MBC6423372.1 FtsX-like permease family protein [Hormoscilla sp. SP12CHS1]MBC6455218.1 FtsX-like permease family protein [Hormoscilla sp. SP5CHS1]